MEKNNLALPIAIVVAGALIAGVMFYNNKNTINVSPTGGNDKSQVQKINLAPITDKDSILGDINAPVVVLEYSDTECPFCKNFHQTMQALMEEYKGQVAWAYRYFPLDSLHKKARPEAQALECAKVQGGNDKFWAFLNEIITETNSNDSLPSTALPKIAKMVGIDVTKFNTCLTNNETAQVVTDQAKTGSAVGVQGTPNNFLIFKTALNKDSVAKILDAFKQYPPEFVTISSDSKIVNLSGAMPIDIMRFVIDTGLKQ